MNLKDFSLLKEDDHAYTIGHPKGKSMTIPKSGISAQGHELISKLRKTQTFAEGGEVDEEETPEETEQNETPQPAQAPTKAAQPVADASQAEDTSGDESSEMENPQAAPSPTSPLVAGAQTFGQQIGQAKEAVEKGVEAEKTVGQQTAKAYQTVAQNAQQQMQEFQERLKDYQERDKGLAINIANKNIDPDRYLNNMSTGSKISSALGMILSGIGSGVTGQPNFAHEQLKDAINKDIQAQMNDQSTAMNLWKMNREAMGSDVQATMATQNQYWEIAKAKAMQAMAAAQGPEAKARAAQTVLGLSQNQHENNKMMALYDMANSPNGTQMAGAGGLSNQNPAQMINAFVPKEQVAQANKEMNNLKEAVKLKQGMMQSFNDLANKPFGGALSPSDRASALAAFAGPIGKVSEGRFNRDEAIAQADALLPGKFDSQETLNNKRQRLAQFFDSIVDTSTLDANNIPIHKFASTNLKSAQNAHIPGSVVAVKGKHYKVGPDGDTLIPL